ncbi:hypothetical protein Poli38472_000612 [Pythium oligandrum]|uniref:Uncharacterized protein n=1 Tax=Pythium oligandrum TaxID=41045 RepID=A0A8K1FEI0_PYTOL|nr:hypothetical protein Poli38472_000612 [Pythium oligandrum]|eukprot:TMW60570.1 hypothetical protein Poli38472_000612 [Pythium oligandrum]
MAFLQSTGSMWATQQYFAKKQASTASSTAATEETAEHARRLSRFASSRTSASGSSGQRLQRMHSRSLQDELSTASSHSDESSHSADERDMGGQRNSLPPGFQWSPDVADKTPQILEHSADPHLKDRYYATQIDQGNYVRMGWLIKQGHVWKSWKNRFFVLFRDGTLAYYKSKGKRKMQGSMKLNDGVISIQHVDIRRSGKPYVFQIEKGFYHMWCCCSSQFEAELWVNTLRSVREEACTPRCFEAILTAHEEVSGTLAVSRHLNKIFVTDSRVVSKLSAFRYAILSHSVETVYEFIETLEDMIMDAYVGELYHELEVEMMVGNELMKLVRRHVEDRVFIQLAGSVYSNLESSNLRASRNAILKNIKLLKSKHQVDFGIPEDFAEISTWTTVRHIVNTLDCVSLPSHKLELIINAGTSIVDIIAKQHGALVEIPDHTLSTIFRFVLVNSSLDDLAMTNALLQPVYLHHPACHMQNNIVRAFLEAIKWIEGYKATEGGVAATGMTLASSRLDVLISTVDIGILFSTDGNGRGAIVHSVRKLSQAALSASVVPGLSLIAINDEPVILMSCRDICKKLRAAPLPKKLTFMTEFCYYQMLSLDHEMYQYLLCLAAGRGDRDSVGWLMGSQLDLNDLCTWEHKRGKQIFGFTPPRSRGTALHAAAFGGHLSMVQYLVHLGANLSVRDRMGQTALHLVNTKCHDMTKIIQRLKEAGADLNASDRNGLTPLMAVTSQESLEGVTELLDLGADITRVAWSNGFTALEFAVETRNVELAKLLLSRGADPNHPTIDDDTSLHLAAAEGSIAVLELLVKSGGDVNRQNRCGQTPGMLLLACGQQRADPVVVEKCLQLLHRSGYDAGKRDLLGRQLSHVAHLLDDKSVSEMVRRLFQAESQDHDAIDIFGCSPLDYSLGHLTPYAVDRRVLNLKQISWPVPFSIEVPGRRDSGSSRSRTFEDLVHRLLHSTSVTLTDVVSFVVFLETFSSIDTLLKQLQASTTHRHHGRGLLRFVVLFTIMKRHHLRGRNDVWAVVLELIQKHLRVSSRRAEKMLKEYSRLYEGYFSLRGSPHHVSAYSLASDAMLERFGSTELPPFTGKFPQNLTIRVDAINFAEQCTVLSHALFTTIPVEDFIVAGSKAAHSNQFTAAKRWFQHLSAYVINAVLIEETYEDRAEMIGYFLEVADSCLALRNYDSLAAILYALQSTAIQRLRRTMEYLSDASKKLLTQMQSLSDKGCREMNKFMHTAQNPVMPYIGLYLQSYVGLNELPVFENGELVNETRLRRLGDLVMEIMHRKSVVYALPLNENINNLLFVELPYDTDESRYTRSLRLEPREAGAVPLGERPSVVANDDLDIENEVRESMGSEGRFGIRQWFRMQKVVQRNRSRSTATQTVYEWV